MSKYIYSFYENQIPEGFFLTFTILLAFFFIVYYLYKLSDIFNKKKLIISIFIAILIFISTNLILWHTQRLINLKKSIAIYPIDADCCKESDKWIGWAISEIIGNGLKQDSSSTLLVYPVDWLQPVANSDSLKYDSYLKSFSARIGAEYYFSGNVYYENNSCYLRYKLHSPEKTIDSAEIKINCNDPHSGLNIAKTLANQLDPELKKNCANLQNVKQSVLKNYTLGKFLLQKNSASEAKDYFELAIKHDSTFIHAWTYLAAANLELGRKAEKSGTSPLEFYNSAKKSLESAQKLDSTDTQNNQFYAKHYIITQKWGLAEIKLRQMIKQNPFNPYIYLYLTQLHSSRYMDLGFENEEDLLEHALALYPGFVDAAISLSDYYYNYKQDYKPALKVLQRMLKINPSQVSVLMNLGKIYISANKVLPVINTYKKIIEIDPTNSNAYYNLGILYFNTKEYESALKLFQRAIKIDNHPDSHLYSAYIFEKMYKAEKDSIKRTEHFENAIHHLRLRIRNRRGQDDQYAETAREHLFYLLHQ